MSVFYTKDTLLSIKALSHHRWALPVLAELGRSGGSRFAPLANRLGVSRDALRKTLAALIDSELVMRAPGYGHPLRPEYVLTENGARIAPICARIVNVMRTLGVEDVGLHKWSLPILTRLVHEQRFSELRRDLGTTPRALSLALKELTRAGLVERRVHDEFPPATTYAATSTGRPLRSQALLLQAAL